VSLNDKESFEDKESLKERESVEESVEDFWMILLPETYLLLQSLFFNFY
jgi:hypothetical protein